MRPYFAIIKDAFREAFASRVFWVVLVLIVLFLGLLFPIGYRQQLTTGVSVSDVKDWPRFIRRMVRQVDNNSPAPGKHLISMFSEKLQKELLGDDDDKQDEDPGPESSESGQDDAGEAAEDDQKPDDGNANRRRRREPQDFMLPMKIVNELNTRVLTKAEFYDEPSWDRRKLRGEAEDLLNRDATSLSEIEMGHRNRLLLDSAFPNDIVPAPTRSVFMTYAGFNITESPFRVEQRVFQETIQLIVLWGLLLIFGTVGIFASILVTASIIPQTFDPGSLNLLLSKPISRSVMFITQYFGGCVFIGLWATLLFSGIYLFLGIRLDYWNPNLLFYIPSFVFIFAIYYSVSAMVGLIWRSPIMATVITLVFWIICAGVGWLNFGAETFVLANLKSTAMMVAGDEVFPLDESRRPLRLNQLGNWNELHSGSGGRGSGPPGLTSSMGPVFDAKRNRYITQEITINQGSPMPFVQRPEFSFAGQGDGWKLHVGEVMPSGTVALVPHPKFGFCAVTSDTVFKYDGELKLPEKKDVDTETADKDEKQSGFAGLLNRFASAKPSENFVEIGPDDSQFFLANPFAITANQGSGDFAVYSRGLLMRLKLNADDQLQVVASTDVDLSPRTEVKLSYLSDKILLAPANQAIRVYQQDSLKQLDNLKLEQRVDIRSISVSPDNSMAALVFQNQRLWIFDANTGEFRRPNIAGGNNVNAAAFNSKGQLVHVNDYREIRIVDLETGQAVDTIIGNYTVAQRVSRYLIQPLHSIFPQPSRLNNTVQFFVTGDDTREDYRATLLRLVTAANPMVPMGQLAELFPRVNLYPWPPVWNGIAFLTIMLMIGCIYIERQQF